MRKFLCLLLCAAMVMSMSVTAFAAESEGSQSPEPAQTQPHEHSWGEGTVTTAATCTENGTRTYTCACGESKTESIAAKGHTMTGAVTTAPGCTTAGVKTNTCSVCGQTATEEVPATGHTFGEWDGNADSHFRTCTVCGKTESDSHSWMNEVVEVDSTCTEEGVVAVFCTVCGGCIYEVIPMKAHTYDSVCDPDCNVCGATREAEHNFSTAWSKDYSGHWHACIKCGEKADIGKHFPGPAATEEKAQLCLTCGYTLTARLNHEHEYSTEWTSDETGHWYACAGCEEQKNFEGHVYDDLCDAECNVCGFQTGYAHSFEGEWFSDETGHWQACVFCDDLSISAPHTPDVESGLCSVCGHAAEPAETEPHEHVYAEEWFSNESVHWQECECGEKTEAVEHTWDEGTENEDGTVTYVCTECNAQRVEEPAEPESGFHWWIVLVILLVALAGAVAALIFVLKPKKKGKFSD